MSLLDDLQTVAGGTKHPSPEGDAVNRLRAALLRFEELEATCHDLASALNLWQPIHDTPHARYRDDVMSRYIDYPALPTK